MAFLGRGGPLRRPGGAAGRQEGRTYARDKWPHSPDTPKPAGGFPTVTARERFDPGLAMSNDMSCAPMVVVTIGLHL
jgi:hypothetical protein